MLLRELYADGYEVFSIYKDGCVRRLSYKEGEMLTPELKSGLSL